MLLDCFLRGADLIDPLESTGTKLEVKSRVKVWKTKERLERKIGERIGLESLIDSSLRRNL